LADPDVSQFRFKNDTDDNWLFLLRHVTKTQGFNALNKQRRSGDLTGAQADEINASMRGAGGGIGRGEVSIDYLYYNPKNMPKKFRCDWNSFAADLNFLSGIDLPLMAPSLLKATKIIDQVRLTFGGNGPQGTYKLR
jgi:hypothetical protein